MKDTLSIKQIQADGLCVTFISFKILATVLCKSWYPAELAVLCTYSLVCLHIEYAKASFPVN